MKRHRRDYEMMTDMNLTNLLDTAFVLLIAFIMASPSMRPGLHVDLPEPGQMTTVINEEKPIEITIQKDKDTSLPERIYVDGENRVDVNDDSGPQSLMTYIKGKITANPNQKLAVVISADKDIRFDVFAKVLAVLSNLGVTNVGLPMAPREPAPPPTPTPKPAAGRRSP